MSNKFLLNPSSNAVSNPLEEDLDAGGNNIEQVNRLCLQSNTGNQICLSAEDGLTPGYDIIFPDQPGVSGNVLELDVDNTTLFWTSAPSGSGDVSGPNPAISTDNAIVRWDGTGGRDIQNSTVTLDSGIMEFNGNFIENSTGTFQINQNANSVLLIDNKGTSQTQIKSNGLMLLEVATSTSSNSIDIQTANGGIWLTTGTGVNDSVRLNTTSLLLSETGQLGNFLTLTVPALSASFGYTFPNALPVSNSFLQVDTSGNISYQSALTNPLTANLDFDQFGADNISSVRNLSGSLDVETSGQLTLQQTGAGQMDIIHSGGSGNLAIQNGNGRIDINSSSTDAFAISIDANSGGARVKTVKPIILETTSSDDLNDIWLDCSAGKILNESLNWRGLFTGTNANTFLIDCALGGADMNFGLDFDLDVGGDIDMTATDVLIQASSPSNPSAIELSCTGGGGIVLTSAGLNPISLNNSEFDTSGSLTMTSNESIFLTDAGVSFSSGLFTTTLLNASSPTQNLSLRLPNDTPAVDDVMYISSFSAGLGTLMFDSPENLLDNKTISNLNIDGSLSFERTLNGRKTIIVPSTSILADYTLTLPPSISGLGVGEFGALVTDMNGNMVFSTDITNVVSAVEPLDNNDQIVMSNASVPYTIKRAPATVIAARFSGMIDGVLPSSTADVVQIDATDGNTTFDIAVSGDILHTDESNPQQVDHIQKTVPQILTIACTLLGNPAIGNVFIYLDARSSPITSADVIQRTEAPGTKQNYEIYLGNLDLRDDVGTNDVIQRANPFSETAYSLSDTLNQLALSKSRNLSGCVFSDTGVADLSITHTAGEGIRLGSNTINDVENPDRIPTALGQFSFVKYHYIDTNGDTIISTLPGITTDPTMWNNAGVLSAVSPVGRFTIQYIYFFYGSNTARIVYGTQLYATLADARNDVFSFGEQFKSPSTKEAILVGCYLSAGNTTDNTDPLQAEFITLSE